MYAIRSYYDLLKDEYKFLYNGINTDWDHILSSLIHLYINSPGGSVTAGMAIYDTMNFIKPDVATICIV